MILILLAHDQTMYRLIEKQIGFAWTFCFSELGFGSYVYPLVSLQNGPRNDMHFEQKERTFSQQK